MLGSIGKLRWVSRGKCQSQLAGHEVFAQGLIGYCAVWVEKIAATLVETAYGLNNLTVVIAVSMHNPLYLDVAAKQIKHAGEVGGISGVKGRRNARHGGMGQWPV